MISEATRWLLIDQVDKVIFDRCLLRTLSNSSANSFKTSLEATLGKSLTAKSLTHLLRFKLPPPHPSKSCHIFPWSSEKPKPCVSVHCHCASWCAVFLGETSIALDALFLFEHAAADDAKGEAEDRHGNRWKWKIWKRYSSKLDWYWGWSWSRAGG